MTATLESLTVDIPGRPGLGPAAQIDGTYKLSAPFATEIFSAIAKCRSITLIDGHPASIIGLRMTGQSTIENIGITYTSHGNVHTRDYSKEEFYNIK